MQRFVQILAVAAAAGSVAADNSVVTSLLLPYNDPNDFVATVLNVDQSATTFAYTCASSVSPDDCGMDTHGTIVQGPSTWQMTLSQSDDEDGLSALTAACALTSSKNEASCTVSETQSDSETHGSSTKTGIMTGYSSDLQAVTIIAGLEKLSNGAGATATTASSTKGASSSGAKSTGGASQSSSSGAASSASGSKTATPNAAPAVTQQAVLAGVAAVVGALAL